MMDLPENLFANLSGWRDAETGLLVTHTEFENRGGVVDGHFELELDGERIGELVFECVIPDAAIVVRSADFGPLAGQGVASRYYDWALPIVQAAGIQRLGSCPSRGHELLLAKGWGDNTSDGLGTMAIDLAT